MREVICKRYINKMLIIIMGVVLGMQITCVADASGLKTEEINVHTKEDDVMKDIADFLYETEKSEISKTELEKSVDNEGELYNDKIGKDLRELMELADDQKLIRTTIHLEKIEDAVLDEMLAGIDDYEERLNLIDELYWKDAGAIIERHFPLDGKERIDKWYMEARVLSIYATKAEIKLLAEDTTITYLSGVVPESSFSDESAELVLIEAKAAARANLRGYKDLSLYRPEQQAELKQLIEKGILEVKNSSSTYYVRMAVMRTEKEMDAVKTHQQLLDEENGNAGNQDGDGSGETDLGNQGGDSSGETDLGNQDGDSSGETNSGDQGEDESGNVNAGNQSGNHSGNANVGNQSGNYSGNVNTGNQGNDGTGSIDTGSQDGNGSSEMNVSNQGGHDTDNIEENDIENREIVDSRNGYTGEVKSDEPEDEKDIQKKHEEAEGESERHRTDTVWGFVVVGIVLFPVLIIFSVRHMKKHKE